jgi:hypothetical protein
MKIPIAYEPIEGKTYSLFGKSNSTSEYYKQIKSIADLILEKYDDPNILLKDIQKYSGKKKFIKRISNRKEDEEFISFLIHLLNTSLSDYTQNVETHLRNLSILKFWDRRLGTTREQYHLYMLEIELTNRLNITKFKKADQKIALLPYCLKDFDVNCKSRPDDFDFQCKSCSKNCYQNYITSLLKSYDIDAYIWMGGNLKQNARKTLISNQTFSVLGIACIPELIAGMRKCQKYNLPVIGFPLDANRCIRWMGQFHKNSINLKELEFLIGVKK